MKVLVTNVFERILKSKKNIILNIGGARSSKSYSTLQYLLFKFFNEENKKILICRKTLPALRMSTFLPFLDMLKQFPYYAFCEINKSERTIKFRNNLIYFTSIDDPHKIKSTEFNYIFMEEVNEFDYEDYVTLNLRLSAPTKENEPNKLLMAMNPITCWVNEKLINDPKVEVIKSTYKDNPFLSKQYVEMIESLKEQDEIYWRIYGLGEFAEISNLIYTNWKIIPDIEFEKIKFDEVIYGLDFGYNSPTALVMIGIKDKIIYEKELLYQTGLTNQDLIQKLRELNINGTIFADSEEPQRIEEIYRAGFMIKPAKKEVQEGIDFVKRMDIRICESSVNLIKEKKFYKWQTDKNGNIIDKPVKFNDHLMDAERYAIYTYFYDLGTKSNKKAFEMFLRFYNDNIDF